MRAIAICQRLLSFAQSGNRSGTVHSVFDHAVNLELGEDGLIGIVAQEKALTPYAVSARMSDPFTKAGVRAGMAAYLQDGSINIPEAEISIDLSTASSSDLSVDAIEIQHLHDAKPILEGLILESLAEADTQYALAPLVTGKGENVYTRFLAPRLKHLFSAMEQGSYEEAEQAAASCAGCGMGLTPSSDDLLCGYISTLHLLLRAQGRLNARNALSAIAQAAASRTNRISGTFLLHSGVALTNAAFCDLYRSIFTEFNTIAATDAIARVRAIGSTSGTDMLTGVVCALRQHFGGDDI